MAKQKISLGAAPDDGTGDDARTGGEKINANFDELYAAVAQLAPKDSPSITTRLDLATAGYSASWRPDESGDLALYVGAAGAADGAQIKAATVNKATGRVTAHFGLVVASSSTVLGDYADTRLLTANGRGWRLVSEATGTTPGNLTLQATTDRFVSNFTNGLVITPTGSVGIGTNAPVSSLHVIGAVTAKAPPSGVTVDNRANDANTFNITRYLNANGTVEWARVTAEPTLWRLSVGASFPLRCTTALVGPGTDNNITCGASGNRWSVVYAGTGTINTSDAREKTPVRSLTEAELAAARDLRAEVGIFQWLDMVEQKGADSARLHVGMTVQRAIEIMEGHGLDPWRYGFICRDEIVRKVKVMQSQTVQATEEVEETYLDIDIRDGVPVQVAKTRIVQRPLVNLVAVVDEAGTPVLQDDEPLTHPVPVMITVEREVEIDEPAGDRLGFRYDQLAMFMLAGLVAEPMAGG